METQLGWDSFILKHGERSTAFGTWPHKIGFGRRGGERRSGRRLVGRSTRPYLVKLYYDKDNTLPVLACGEGISADG